MNLFRVSLPACLLLLLVTACATPGPAVRAGVACAARDFSVADDFVAARRGACTVLSRSAVKVEIRREDERVINPSPWFAFRIDPARPVNARIRIDYGTWEHRYVPKISDDGRHWRVLPAEQVVGNAGDRQIELRLALGDGPVWIAAQEIVAAPDYEAWSARLIEGTDAELTLLGQSFGGRPIHLLENPGDSRDVVLLSGRQHPPEVSGAYAFFAFVETIFGDTELAAAFRERFRVMAIPLLNPDGVAAGHWRHSFGAVDLNRDWGPFTQPETRLVKDLLARLDREGGHPRVFIDFHSTDRNLFYTQSDEDVTDPPGFTDRWFERARPKLENYAFSNEKRPTSETANGKNYMYKRYGIPSLTYEVGDETTREDAAAAARVFAVEFMRLLLDEAD